MIFYSFTSERYGVRGSERSASEFILSLSTPMLGFRVNIIDLRLSIILQRRFFSIGIELGHANPVQ